MSPFAGWSDLALDTVVVISADCVSDQILCRSPTPITLVFRFGGGLILSIDANRRFESVQIFSLVRANLAGPSLSCG
jgi:hypothetical protein